MRTLLDMIQVIKRLKLLPVIIVITDKTTYKLLGISPVIIYVCKCIYT